MTTLTLSVGADGVALITLNQYVKAMNVVSPEFIDELSGAIEEVAGNKAIRGAVITSAKSSFMAGADLKYIATLAGRGDLRHAYAFSRKPSAMHRRLETCGKPFVAAINGLALGGGYELALACHYRIIVDDPKAITGLPEVSVGLLPGSGGTQRLLRMIGLKAAVPVLLDAKTMTPQEALMLGMVDRIVPAQELLTAAREWILSSPSSTRVWDEKGYRNPGGLLDPAVVAITSAMPAKIAERTQHNYPAPIAILDCLFEGSLLPFDKALDVESKHFARLLAGPVSLNLIRTNFVNKGEANKLARRPPGIAKSATKTVAVLGAGLMGSGVAYVAAAAGIEVILLDTSIDKAQAGRRYSETVLQKAIARGSRTREDADAILSRIRPTVDFADLATADVVVEAVFEDVAVKADVTSRAEQVLGGRAIFASNTSTLPITELAQASARPERFIGLHFFSPVERMPLVEVIRGRKTSEETLAQALDFVAQLRMTPILVNDSRGFYTSRVFQTFIHEGMKMLEDGIEPPRIENAARQAGFPVGPLALLDEVTIDLPWKIVQQAEKAVGSAFLRPCAYEVMRRMLHEAKRPGRRQGGGFYDYPTDGPKQLWQGLAEIFPVKDVQPDVDTLKRRFLYIQGLETARCYEEGVLTDAADADVGALLAWGFPSWTGGPLALIDTVGTACFVEECDLLAAHWGSRFTPSPWLRDRAHRGAVFYPRVAQGSDGAAGDRET